MRLPRFMILLWPPAWVRVWKDRQSAKLEQIVSQRVQEVLLKQLKGMREGRHQGTLKHWSRGQRRQRRKLYEQAKRQADELARKEKQLARLGVKQKKEPEVLPPGPA